MRIHIHANRGGQSIFPNHPPTIASTPARARTSEHGPFPAAPAAPASHRPWGQARSGLGSGAGRWRARVGAGCGPANTPAGSVAPSMLAHRGAPGHTDASSCPRARGGGRSRRRLAHSQAPCTPTDTGAALLWARGASGRRRLVGRARRRGRRREGRRRSGQSAGRRDWRMGVGS